MFKKLFVMAAMVLSTSAAFAQGAANNGGIQGYLGFNAGALNVGAEYEAPQHFGGYFFLLTDDEDNGVPQVLTFGAFAKAHLVQNNAWDVYLSPGFGIAIIDLPQDDETTFGPSFRTGVLYNFSSQIAAGLEHAFFFNWFSDDAPGQVNVINATVRFNL